VSTEHTIATDDEDYPGGNPLDDWYNDLEELPIEPEEEQ
jgi:hypothetical protein